MESGVNKKLLLSVLALALGLLPLSAREDGGDKVTHRVGVDMRGAWLMPTKGFFRGENAMGERLDKSASVHLKYSFRFPSASRYGSMYPTAYQGVGVAWNTFFDKSEIGNPAALYLFQGRGSPLWGRIFRWTTSGISGRRSAGILMTRSRTRTTGW